MGLPDIEAYIDQKIPSEPVTEDLLVALPRKPREGVEREAAEGESVSEIFREAREQRAAEDARRSEEHTSELQSLMRISYAVLCLTKKNNTPHQRYPNHTILDTKQYT